MIAPEPTRTTLRRLVAAGFTSRPGKGSHTMWICRHGVVTVTVASGHNSQSPGVVRTVNKAIAQCQAQCTEES
ncbi:type II toxin-antitoxin system HicA family toxin [Nocardia asteroides]|uniref:type II toxin-antitoxin system HicA family toxin n=1 Tax=Nocardia asteroides TaxID=1824 RepID=UPI00342761B1